MMTTNENVENLISQPSPPSESRLAQELSSSQKGAQHPLLRTRLNLPTQKQTENTYRTNLVLNDWLTCLGTKGFRMRKCESLTGMTLKKIYLWDADGTVPARVLLYVLW